MPPPKGLRSQAATDREAGRRGELPPAVPVDPTDPDYVLSLSDLDNDGDKITRVSGPSSNLRKVEILTNREAIKRQQRRENSDILPNAEQSKPRGSSKSTLRRNEKGLTKKAAKAKKELDAPLQQSVLTGLFALCPNPSSVTAATTSDNTPNRGDAMELTVAGSEIGNSDGGMDVDIPTDRDIGMMTGSECGPSDFEFEHDQEVSIPIDDLDDFEPDAGTGCEGLGGLDNIERPTSGDDSALVSEVETHVESPPSIASAPDAARQDDSKNDPKFFFTTVEQNIKHLRKELNKKKTPSDCQDVANQLVELTKIEQYNQRRYELHQERTRLKLSLTVQQKSLHHKIKQRIAKIRPANDASMEVAKRFNRGPWFARLVRSSTNTLFTTGKLSKNKQGQGAHHESLLGDPRIHDALQKWVKGMVPPEKGGFIGNQMFPSTMRRYVNSFLLPELEIDQTISESTAVRWLKKLGFSLCRVQKGIYVDGHERKDVVKSRQSFVNYLYTQVLPFCYEYILPDEDSEDQVLVEIPPTLLDGTKIHYPIFHDETCIHANDQSGYVWMRKGEQPLRSKGRGRVIHISDFIIEHSGRLALSPDEIKAQMKLPEFPVASSDADHSSTTKGKRKAKKRKVAPTEEEKRVERSLAEHEKNWAASEELKGYRLKGFDTRRIIYPGANYDAWWDMPQLLAQTKDAIDIFETKYPDGVAVFIFDCSSAHEAYASDALLAHKMNRNPSGQQPIMHDTYNPATGQVQSMVFSANYKGIDKDGNSLAGRPKGMEQVLRERRLLEPLQKKHKKFHGVCAYCKKSQAARDAVQKEAREKQDEVEGSGLPSLNTRGISQHDIDDNDPNRSADCCMQRVLSLQEDFLQEKPLLQVLIERAGHKCLFLPKFHCEFNPIELVWAQVKRYFRERADGTFPTAQRLAREALDNVSTDNVRRCFRHCWRYMEAYRLDLNIRQAAYAVKEYKSHRRIPASAVKDAGIRALADSSKDQG
ncbi:hypothetical protein BDN72DRAFT_913924 [Pluteus cervinus]|uniref:Uncharacterized protein n=1 Tax=Pluteus cervinus TaxID=181527 RepID=A0ACD3ANK8_9AGAR|nr:hypothetical protein BDN72DRAFT_913924 [Pluteus cervinus]